MASKKIKVDSAQTPSGELPTADDLGLTSPSSASDAPEEPTDVVGSLEAGAAGVARSATLGLSDLALTNIPTDITGTPLVAPEKLEKLKEEHPTATMVGEVGGMFVPALGELGAIGKAAKIASAPLTAASAVGNIVGEAATKAITSKIIGKLAAGSAKTAAEALVYNAGNNLSEAVLGDKDITAERLLAGSRKALMFGAGLGFGATGAGVALEAAANKAKASVGKLQGWINDNVINPVESKAMDISAKQVAEKEGLSVEEARSAIDALKNPISPEQRDMMQRQFQENLTETWSAVQSTKKKLWGEIRPREVDSLLEHADAAKTVESAQGLVGKVDETIAKLKADPTAFDQAYVRDLEGIRNKMQSNLGEEASAADVYHLMNGLKKTELTDLSEFSRNLEGASRATTNSLKEVRSLYRDFAGHLEDESVYGSAAVRQGSVNDSFSSLERITGKGSPFRKYFMERTSKGYELSATKINTFFGKVGSARGGSEAKLLAPQNALREFVDAAKGFTEEVANSNATAGVESFDKEGIKSLLEKTQAQHEEASQKLAHDSMVRARFPQQEASHGGGGLLNLAIDHALGGPVGTAAGAVLSARGMISDPRKLIAAMSRIEGISNATTKAIDSSVTGFLSGTAKAAKAISHSSSLSQFAADEAAPLLQHKMGDGPDHDNKHDAYKHAQEVLSQAQADPMGVAEKMGKGLQRMDATPEIKQTVVNKQMQAMGFLASKMPKNPFAGYPGQDKYRPSDAEMSKFERYVKAAADPMTVLNDLHRGRVTPEAVETLENVYPKLFEQVQKTLLMKAPEMENLPYEKRVQLSLLFKVPLDPSAKPEMIFAFQQRLEKVGQAPQQQQPMGGGHIKGPPLKTPGTYQTEAQRHEQDR